MHCHGRLPRPGRLVRKVRFIPIEGTAKDGPRKMFLDVRTIRAALKGGSAQE